MNIEKLKDRCQFCKYYVDDMQIMNCEKIYVICKRVQSTWQLHPDIEEAMQPGTTELKPTESWGVLPHLQVTACCGIGPITNENYCPSCGRRIVK